MKLKDSLKKFALKKVKVLLFEIRTEDVDLIFSLQLCFFYWSIKIHFLVPNFSNYECENVFEFSDYARLVSPVGCPECSGVAFCGRECQEVACGTYHKAECHFLNLFIGLGMSVLCHLALRIVARTGNETETFCPLTPHRFFAVRSQTRVCARERKREWNQFGRQTNCTHRLNDAAMCQAPFLQFAGAGHLLDQHWWELNSIFKANLISKLT